MLVLVFPTFMGTTSFPKPAATSALSSTRNRNLLIHAGCARAAEWEGITSVPDALKNFFFPIQKGDFDVYLMPQVKKLAVLEAGG